MHDSTGVSKPDTVHLCAKIGTKLVVGQNREKRGRGCAIVAVS